MRYCDLIESADLRAEPFQAPDPISRQMMTSYHILRGGERIGAISGRFAKSPEEALLRYQERQSQPDRWTTPGLVRTPPVAKPSKFEIVTDPIDSLDAPDDYYYHVTSRPKQVLRRGLRPSQRPSMGEGFYRSYSAGKVFFCDRPGVSYWLWRIADHLEAQYERPPKLSVVRFPKSLVSDAQEDRLGTEDSGAGSYFVTHPI